MISQLKALVHTGLPPEPLIPPAFIAHEQKVVVVLTYSFSKKAFLTFGTLVRDESTTGVKKRDYQGKQFVSWSIYCLASFHKLWNWKTGRNHTGQHFLNWFFPEIVLTDVNMHIDICDAQISLKNCLWFFFSLLLAPHDHFNSLLISLWSSKRKQRTRHFPSLFGH